MGTSAIQALDLTFRQFLGGGRLQVADVLNRLAPSIDVQNQLDVVVGWVESADRAAQERNALPLLRLFGLACTDGILRRGARAGGALAGHFDALLAVHVTRVEARAANLRAQC